MLRYFAVATGAGYQVMTGGLGQVAAAPRWSRTERQAPLAEGRLDPQHPRRPPPSRRGCARPRRPEVLPPTIAPRSPRTCSGWAATPSGPRTPPACCARSDDRWADFHNSPATPGAEALAVLLEALTEVTGDLAGLPRHRTARPGSPGARPSWSRCRRRRPPGHPRLRGAAADRRRRRRPRAAVHRHLAGARRPGTRAGELRRRPADHAACSPRTSDVLARVLEGLLALSGLIAESMVRDAGWRFMRDRPPGRARAARDRAAAGDGRPGRAGAGTAWSRVGADRGGEHHHLPPPLPGPGRRRHRARPAAARPGEPAGRSPTSSTGSASARPIPAESERITPVRETPGESVARRPQADTPALARADARRPPRRLRAVLAGAGRRA